MACGNCEDCNEEKKVNIEEKVDEVSDSIDSSAKESENPKEQEEKPSKKYEDPIKDDYQIEKENQFGSENIHKPTWDKRYLDDDIL